MRRSLVASTLVAGLALAGTGCGVGYVTYFEPGLKGAGPALHRDPYTHPPAPAGVELASGAVSVGCTNLRKFLLLPIPWFRLAFFPTELQVEVAFHREPERVRLDLGAVRATLDGKPVTPLRVEYRAIRPAPKYVETVVLPAGARVKLLTPSHLVFVFRSEARETDQFRIQIPQLDIDGARTVIPALAFERAGQFVVYRRAPSNKSRPGDPESLAESGDDL